MRWLALALALLPGAALAAPTVYAPAGAVAQLPQSRTLEVATRAVVPNYFSAANTALMGRSVHWTRETVPAGWQACFANFYVHAGYGDTPSGGVTSITASYEYPLGTFHQMTFGGQVTGSIPSGAILCSDGNQAGIPNYTEIAIREHETNSAGIVLQAYGVASAVTGYDALNFGTSAPDQTMGGTISETLGLFTSVPVAIIAPSVRPAVCLFGDSRVFGLLDNRNDATGDGGELERKLGPSYAYINLGVPSDLESGTLGVPSPYTGTPTAQQIATATADRQQIAQWCTIGINELGINDANGGIPAATIASDRTIFANTFGLPMYGTTLAPYTTTTDACATTANQTVGTNEAIRSAFNALERTGISGELNYIDINDMIDPTRSGKWPVNGSANGYVGDTNNVCLHENSLGAQLIQRSATWPTIDFNRY